MINYKYPATDPLGEIHLMQVLLPEGGNWYRESNRDDCHRAISRNRHNPRHRRPHHAADAFDAGTDAGRPARAEAKEGPEIIMSVWICSAIAECDDCDVEYHSNNAMGLMAKHCKKTGHRGEVTIDYVIDPTQ